jgi:hypothetical protein
MGLSLLNDPWAARNDYVAVMGDRSDASLNAFFAAHQSHELSASERVTALQLLEMQRHALLMYTSCGWFFDEISRPEGTQILRYAARALELAGEVAGIALDPEFVQRLDLAPSNVGTSKPGPGSMNIWCALPHFPGAGGGPLRHEFPVYRLPPRAGHLLLHRRQQDYRRQRLGPLSLAVGQVEIISTITREV